MKGVERARQTEDGESRARCLEEADAEREAEEKLKHEVAIDRLSEERHRWFPPSSAQRASSCHPTPYSAAGAPNNGTLRQCSPARPSAAVQSWAVIARYAFVCVLSATSIVTRLIAMTPIIEQRPKMATRMNDPFQTKPSIAATNPARNARLARMTAREHRRRTRQLEQGIAWRPARRQPVGCDPSSRAHHGTAGTRAACERPPIDQTGLAARAEERCTDLLARSGQPAFIKASSAQRCVQLRAAPRSFPWR